MTSPPSSPVEEIKARLDIADVVGQTVQLRRSGRNFKGLCPFHSEKTPSFYVFPETGSWHCFGCGEGGDAFSFLMKRDNLEFVEALRDLAARAGVALAPPSETAAARQQFEPLYRVLEACALYYQALLGQASGRATRDYLARRQVSAEAQQQFGLGYSLDNPAALQRYLADKGFTVDEMIAAGLVGRGERGDSYDLLRGRLIFPIRDAEGRVIAFGGRALSDSVQPKYLNGPQTLLFDKSACLYAFDAARPHIRQTSQAVIVEGYLDAIAAHQAGHKNVVATLGTAITERHLTLLKRGAPEILLALDADEAGQTAALRALEVAGRALADEAVPVPTAQGRIRYQAKGRARVKVMVLPPGQDPDDLLHQDPSHWTSLVASAMPVVDFVLSRLPFRFDLSLPQGKSTAAEEALGAIAGLPDPVERAHYLQRLASLLGVNESALVERLRGRGIRQKKPVESGHAAQGDTLEAYALALVATVGHPEAVQLEPADFQQPAHRAVFAALGSVAGRLADPASLGDDLPAELSAVWASVLIHFGGFDALPPNKLTEERERAALELRHRRLLLEHERVAALLQGETAEEAAEARQTWVRKLQDLSAELDAITRLKVQWGRIGSMVPRYRRAAEVLGG